MSHELPQDAHGYAVDPAGVVHTRYAEHAVNAPRTRTALGALAILAGREPTICDECYPSVVWYESGETIRLPAGEHSPSCSAVALGATDATTGEPICDCGLAEQAASVSGAGAPGSATPSESDPPAPAPVDGQA